ncbi:helix-turn-helix transcriptional regulator [Paraburkholderia oxyphila]|uniref:helix-turn-helix transcriptional regulator n=1 Tax=Paraburkholderia oxyphila TaxID=614212 RepID=UPI0005BA13A2|nr:AlpA family phage regulatory protein [Paraburkholderia oxyphila]
MSASPLIRLPELEQLTHRCKGSIYNDMKAGRFPQSIKIGPRAIAWHRADVERWLANPAGYAQ